jgi:hypothetical protein
LGLLSQLITLEIKLKQLKLKYEVLDSRYTFNLEWCGVATQQYITRFLGDFIAASATYKEAYIKGCIYEAQRLGVTL